MIRDHSDICKEIIRLCRPIDHSLLSLTPSPPSCFPPPTTCCIPHVFATSSPSQKLFTQNTKTKTCTKTTQVSHCMPTKYTSPTFCGEKEEEEEEEEEQVDFRTRQRGSGVPHGSLPLSVPCLGNIVPASCLWREGDPPQGMVDAYGGAEGEARRQAGDGA